MQKIGYHRLSQHWYMERENGDWMRISCGGENCLNVYKCKDTKGELTVHAMLDKSIHTLSFRGDEGWVDLPDYISNKYNKKQQLEEFEDFDLLEFRILDLEL